MDNLGGWLTTVVARVCLDMLRARARKESVSAATRPPTRSPLPPPRTRRCSPTRSAWRSLVVLDTLSPAERLAFVLHDMFAVPFEEIAPIVGRTPVAARQLASRARRRVQSDPVVPDASPPPNAGGRRLPAAARHGDFEGLLGLLDPDVVLRADSVAVEMAAARAGAGAWN